MFRLLANKDGPKRQGKNCLYHNTWSLPLRSHAIWIGQCSVRIPKAHGSCSIGIEVVNMSLYLNDNVVFSQTFDQHIKRLEMVFSNLQAANIKCRPNRCEFAKSSIKYLGFIVSRERVKPSKSKILAIEKCAKAKTVKQGRRFLGICGYYGKFVEDFADIARPLINLTMNNTPFKFDENCQKAFIQLKTNLTKALILTLLKDGHQKYYILMPAT